MALSASLLLLFLAQAAPAATSVALLTAVGEAEGAAKRDVDAALRKAVEAQPTFSLLSSAETKEQLSSLADMGLICLPEDTTCFVKLGLAAGVELVLVPVVGPGSDGAVTVEVHVVDVAASSQARVVSAAVSATDQAALARLARQALGLEQAADLPPPPPAEGEGEGEGETPPATAPEPAPIGLIVTGVGGALAGVALVGAVVCDLIYADVINVADAKARRDLYQPLGAALWISSAVGVGVLASGIALMATGQEAAAE